MNTLRKRDMLSERPNLLVFGNPEDSAQVDLHKSMTGAFMTLLYALTALALLIFQLSKLSNE